VGALRRNGRSEYRRP